MSIRCTGLSFAYGPGPLAVDSVDLVAADGGVTALLGSTGSGKSTLLRMVVGLLRPAAGSVEVDGEPVWERRGPFRRSRRRPDLPRLVGYVMQRPERQLFCDTVVEDVAFGPSNLGASPDQARTMALGALDRLGIARLADRRCFELSGGQQRLVAMAGVLAMGPANLVLDEPMAALDPAGRAMVRDALASLGAGDGAVLMVTHDMDDVARLAGACYVLDHGSIALEGTPAEVYSHGDAMRRIGLGVPEAASFARALAAAGLDVGEPLTVDALADAVAAAVGRGRP